MACLHCNTEDTIGHRCICEAVALRAQVTHLEAALRCYGAHDEACPCYPIIPVLPLPLPAPVCTCGLAALSDQGKGMEVREQAQRSGQALSGMLLDAVDFGGRFRAERDAAIEDAAKQRALAEVRLCRGLWAFSSLRLIIQEGVQLTAVAPAEAVPQSGQEEGD